MTTTNLPDAIVRDVLSPRGVVSTRSVPPGMSGAAVYECVAGDGEKLALKRWPEGTSRARMEEVHRVMRQSKQAGCELVPTVQEFANVMIKQGGALTIPSPTVMADGNNYWDLLQWMPGVAANADASLEVIRRGASGIAMFHASLRSLGTKRQSPPAVAARLTRLRQLDSLLPQAIAIDPTSRVGPTEKEKELGAVLAEACRRVRHEWDVVRARIARSLSPYVDKPVETQYVLRDVHRGHVLFSQGSATGIIDFDSLRIDTPATDLARWVGSFLSSQDEIDRVWEAALAGFQSENALITGPRCQIDPKMAKELCFATNWLSLGNWLVWILCERRFFPAGNNAVISRVNELLRVASREA